MCGVVVTLVVMFLAGGQCSDLTSVTEAVFGEEAHSSQLIPAAFGDFNSDKLTDLIVFDSHGRSVAVLLASEQAVVPTDSSPMFRKNQNSLNCSCPDGGKFVSAAPGDFDGDGSMDLMTVSVKENVKSVHIMWGQVTNLECTEHLVTIPDIFSEPLVFDYNKDSVSDLLTVDKDGNRTVYVFPKPRGIYHKEYLTTDQTNPLKAEHGNSFVDITGDGIADLVLTTSEGLEMYKGVNSAEQFEYLSTLQWPNTPDCGADECVGQPVWMDFSLSGIIHMVLPVCGDPLCSDSRLYLVPVSNLSRECYGDPCPWPEAWPPMSLDLGEMLFKPRDPSKSPLQLLTPRVGDVDLDGFPDLLMTMYNKTGGDVTKQGEVQLLLNAPCGPDSGCSPYWRQFQLQPGYTAGLGSAVTGAFFDLYEDGKMDLLVVRQDDKDVYSMSAYTNTTQDSDAYFMKVIVLTGACYHTCDNHDPRFVPYGTNSGGQLVSYQSQRPGQETFDSYQSVAVQLPQTSHYALALPYTIFGLGMAPNFVDYLTANISGQSHSWPQIIPNSQLYVIPFGDSSSWDLKLMITTSKNIVITGLALVGTCALCSIIIVMLHIREKRQDRMAKLQDMKGFHFDAM